MSTPASAAWTLAVTSSTGVMGLAVGRVDDSSVTDVHHVDVVTDRRHAEEIAPRLQELLAGSGITTQDLQRLVIDVGPGRFTGLRVGLATVRALGFALDIPVVGLTSLSILAAGAERRSMVTAVIDARREEVFQQCFADGVPIDDAAVGKPDLLAQRARGVVVGDGLDRYLDSYRQHADGSGLTPTVGAHPMATVMLDMSIGLPGKAGTEVAPLYLRDPDANPNIKTRPSAP